MTTTDVAQRIRGYITENLLYMRPGYELGDQTRLLEERVIDSIGVMEVVTFLEESFGLVVRDEEVTEANLGTIAAMTRFVATKLDLSQAA